MSETKVRPLFTGIAIGGPKDGQTIALPGRMGVLRDRASGRKLGSYTYQGNNWHWKEIETASARAKNQKELAEKLRKADEKRAAKAAKRKGE